MLRKALVLVLALLGSACRDVVSTTEPAPKMLDPNLFFGYWVDTTRYSCPASFTGLGDRPLNGCVGSGFTHIFPDSSLSGNGTMERYIIVQTLEGDSCQDPFNNTFSLVVSLATVADSGLVYQITLNVDAMVHTDRFDDNDHLSELIKLAQAKTQIGSSKRVRLVPKSLSEELALASKFTRANTMKPGDRIVVSAGRLALQ